MYSSLPNSNKLSGPVPNPFVTDKKTDKDKEDIIENKKIIPASIDNSVEFESTTPDTKEPCSNCSVIFVNEADRVLTLASVNKNISIPTALASVYEWRGKDPKYLPRDSIFLRKEVENVPFSLCRTCSSVLCSLYKAFNQFTTLSNSLSLIAKTLDEISSIELMHWDLSKRKSKELEKDFSLLDIKIETEDCLENLEDLIDDPNLIFADINSDNADEGCESDKNFDNDATGSRRSRRPRRKVARKSYCDADYLADDLEQKSDSDFSNSSSDHSDFLDDDFRPQKYIRDKNEANIKKDRSSRGRKRILAKGKIKEEPLDHQTGIPWCVQCSKAFKTVDSLQRHNVRMHIKKVNQTKALSSDESTSEYLVRNQAVNEDDEEKDEGGINDLEGTEKLQLAEKVAQLSLQRKTDGYFPCSDCSKRFKSVKNLRRHVRVHIDEFDSLLKCRTCLKKFSRKEHLTRHIINVHNKNGKGGKKGDLQKIDDKKDNESKSGKQDGEYGCSHCNKVMKSSDSLRRHVRIHTDEDDSRLICKICSRKFTREHHLTRHCSNVHKSPVVLEPRVARMKRKSEMRLKRDAVQKCPICSETFKLRRAEFKAHVHSHGVENPWTCPQCPKSYSDVNRLRQHLARVHHEGRAVYVCHICGLTFGFKHILAQHQVELHTVPNNVDVDTLELMSATILSNSEHKTSYCCSVCSKEYSRKERLTTHMLKHTQYAPHSCDVCGKKFLLERSLKIHSLLHSSQSPFVCVVCDRRFARADHLKRHTEVKHKDGKLIRHVCTVCGKEYNQLHKLKMHMISHTNERPWACDKCDKRFNHPSSLLAHKSTHEDERKFCCSTCGRTFKRWCHLRDHEALHAENIPRPFACTVPNCGKAFKRRKDLRNHTNVHSGVKDNICETCGAAFNRIDNLRAHVRAIHLKDDSVRRRPGKQKNTTRDTVVRLPPKIPNIEEQAPLPINQPEYNLEYSYQYLQPFQQPSSQ